MLTSGIPGHLFECNWILTNLLSWDKPPFWLSPIVVEGCSKSFSKSICLQGLYWKGKQAEICMQKFAIGHGSILIFHIIIHIAQIT